MTATPQTNPMIPTEPTAQKRSGRQKTVLLISRLWAWVFLIGLILFFTVSVSITSGGEVNFLSLRNSQNVLMAITPVLLMGLGQTFVIIAAGIDAERRVGIGRSSLSAVAQAHTTSRGPLNTSPSCQAASPRSWNCRTILAAK